MSSRNTPRAIKSHLCISREEWDYCAVKGCWRLPAFPWNGCWHTPGPEQAVKHAVLMLLHWLHMRSRIMCSADPKITSQDPLITMFQPSSENHMKGLLWLLYPRLMESMTGTDIFLSDHQCNKSNLLPGLICTIHIMNIAQKTTHIHHKQTPWWNMGPIHKKLQPNDSICAFPYSDEWA